MFKFNCNQLADYQTTLSLKTAGRRLAYKPSRCARQWPVRGRRHLGAARTIFLTQPDRSSKSLGSMRNLSCYTVANMGGIEKGGVKADGLYSHDGSLVAIKSQAFCI